MHEKKHLTKREKETWKKITFGLSEEPVTGGRSLPSVKRGVKKEESAYARIRREEGLRRRAAQEDAGPFSAATSASHSRSLSAGMGAGNPYGTAPSPSPATPQQAAQLLLAPERREKRNPKVRVRSPSPKPAKKVKEREKIKAAEKEKEKEKEKVAAGGGISPLLPPVAKVRSRSLPANCNEASKVMTDVTARHLARGMRPAEAVRADVEEMEMRRRNSTGGGGGGGGGSVAATPRSPRRRVSIAPGADMPATPTRKGSFFKTTANNNFDLSKQPRRFSLRFTPSAESPTLSLSPRGGPQRRASGSGNNSNYSDSESASDDGSRPCGVPDYCHRYPPAFVEKVRRDIAADVNPILIKRAENLRSTLVEESGGVSGAYGVIGVLENDNDNDAALLAHTTDLTQEDLANACLAYEADMKSSNPALVEAFRHLLLAHTAYRVPTGSDFWDKVQAIRQGLSRASPVEVLKRYRREAVLMGQNVTDFLNRVHVCTGRTLSLISTTRLDQKVFEEFVGYDAEEEDKQNGVFARRTPVVYRPAPYSATLTYIGETPGGYALFTVEDMWGKHHSATEDEVRPEAGLQEGDPVYIPLSGDEGVVVGTGRGRVGVLVNESNCVYGYLKQDVRPKCPVYAVGDVVWVSPNPIVGEVATDAPHRGRVSVQPYGSTVRLGCLPETLQKRREVRAAPSLWQLIVSQNQSLDFIHMVCYAGALMKEEEKVQEDQDNIKFKELPPVAPGWMIVEDVTDGLKHPERNDTVLDVAICVAGTQNLNDCFRDCMFIPTQLELPAYSAEGVAEHDKPSVPPSFEGVKAHMGFVDGANRIFGQILPELVARRKANPGKTLHVKLTGHSLGGATSLLLGAYLKAANLDNIKVVKVFTYGAPNVFNLEKWDDSTKLKILKGIEVNQYVNEKDLVPRSLGSTLIQKAAKVAIKLGFKELRCVNSSNAESLPHYRFTSDALHHITGGKVICLKTRKEQNAALTLSLAGFRPQAAHDHKMANYIANLIEVYNTETGHTHHYKSDPSSKDSDAMGSHPIVTACFDKDEPTKLSSTLVHACRNISDRLGGITLGTLAAICDWSSKVYPKHLLDTQVFNEGRYERSENNPDQLSVDGFQCFMEDQCYADPHWVCRLLKSIGWEQEGEYKVKFVDGRRTGKDIPRPPPIFHGVPLVERGEAGDQVLTREALRACSEIFASYAHPVFVDPHTQQALRRGTWGWSEVAQRRHFTEYKLLRPECIRALLRNIDISEYGSGHDPTQERVQFLFRNFMEAVPAGIGTTCVDRATRFVTEEGFHHVFELWCADDELRMWNILRKGGGFTEQLTSKKEATLPLWDTAALGKTVKRIDKIVKHAAGNRQQFLSNRLKCKIFDMYISGKNYVSPVQKFLKRKSVPSLQGFQVEDSAPPSPASSAERGPKRKRYTRLERARKNAERAKRQKAKGLCYGVTPYTLMQHVPKVAGARAPGSVASPSPSSKNQKEKLRPELLIYLNPLPPKHIVTIDKKRLHSPQRISLKRSKANPYKHVCHLIPKRNCSKISKHNRCPPHNTKPCPTATWSSMNAKASFRSSRSSIYQAQLQQRCRVGPQRQTARHCSSRSSSPLRQVPIRKVHQSISRRKTSGRKRTNEVSYPSLRHPPVLWKPREHLVSVFTKMLPLFCILHSQSAQRMWLAVAEDRLTAVTLERYRTVCLS